MFSLFVCVFLNFCARKFPKKYENRGTRKVSCTEPHICLLEYLILTGAQLVQIILECFNCLHFILT